MRPSGATILLLCLSSSFCGRPEGRDAAGDLRISESSVLRPLGSEIKPHIQELSIKTSIVSRYAITTVSCSMLNRHSMASEGVFQMLLPAGAYVSNFTMIVGGQVYSGEIRPKLKTTKKAKEQEPHKQKVGQGGQRGSEEEVFRVVTSIPAKERAVFVLSYEQLLQRRLGRYEHVTSLRPLQLVSRLTLEVTIVEHSPITELEVLPLRNGRAITSTSKAKGQGKAMLPVSTVIKQDKNSCKITFTPNIVQQANIARNGVLGDFIIRYDVERELAVGEVQTKEGLLTILNDLHPGDHFNFVSFSNRIKVWQPNRLVPVTPNNIRDAKKFIYMISPSKGRDIGLAIQTGSSLLSSHLPEGGTHHGSVSFMIFLTNGRPTAAEPQIPSILSNATAQARKQFCIFTIGLGEDEDRRLLERLALDNCGMTWHIPGEADVGIMLKGIYDEISTLLLSDIWMTYSDGAEEYVTQHRFAHYFNGSEIVVAGKLSNRSTESLHVQVMASSGDRNVTLESDVMVRQQVSDVVPPAEGYANRLWGLLSIKDCLRLRRSSRSSWEREKLTQRATNLSLDFNFLTPVTSMIVPVPEAHVDKARSNDAANTMDGLLEEMAGNKPQSLRRSNELPGDHVKKSMITISRTSADGDPHFVVDFPLSKLAVCFNINGEPGDVLRLVSDHKHSGVTVNGKLIGTPAPPGSHKRQRTFFGTITIVVDRPQRGYIEITPRKVILDGRDRLVLPCHTTVAVESDGLAVSIVGGSSVTVTLHGTISFVILIHLYKNPEPYQRNHLGFYISNSKGLSKDSHGLLGQFLYQEVGLIPQNGSSILLGLPSNGVPDIPSFSQSFGISPSLKIKDRTVTVVKKTRKIYSGKQKVDCWFVKNNANKLIDGHYEDYVVSHLFDTDDSPHGINA
ncbi:inter-alpha-trypsin inhibitor heavy chain H5-like [Scleropages formosus]|uniref:Inter-alpha-trypsin inhibitor heavy chain H5-like n=1 Tax=Scleropages formosus TaxID=113540 RepID=A0A0P7XIX1_SCLFO|nr:inter-alpha-trypsin inhibitor heavy chain H5-like [Scleropages formosus]